MLLLSGAPRAAFVDAVLAEFDTAVVAASEVGLARALGLFGLRPSDAPISPEEVRNVIRARLLAREADQLDVRVPGDAQEAAWRAIGSARGGLPGLAAWLARNGLSEAWAKEMVAADLRGRRFIDLRFRAFAFVTEFEVEAALGAGQHSEAEREAARQRLMEAEVERSLAEWLAETLDRTTVKLVIADPVPVPFPMP